MNWSSLRYRQKCPCFARKRCLKCHRIPMSAMPSNTSYQNWLFTLQFIWFVCNVWRSLLTEGAYKAPRKLRCWTMQILKLSSYVKDAVSARVSIYDAGIPVAERRRSSPLYTSAAGSAASIDYWTERHLRVTRTSTITAQQRTATCAAMKRGNVYRMNRRLRFHRAQRRSRTRTAVFVNDRLTTSEDMKGNIQFHV